MNTRYPILEEKIILDFLRDTFNEKPDLEILTKPNKDFLLNIFTQFLEILGVKNYLKIDLKAVEEIEDFDEMNNTFSLINISKCIGYMIEKTGVNDFGLSDLIRPKRKRTQLIISQLIGIFLDFAETKDRIFNHEKVDIKEMQIKKEMLLTKYSELEEFRIKKLSQLESFKIEIKPKLDQIVDLINSIKEIKQSSEDLVVEKNKIKKNVVQNKIILSELEYKKSEFKKKIKDLQDQCISNSDFEIFDKLEKKKNALEELRTENLKLNNDLIANSTYYKNLSEAFEEKNISDENFKKIEQDYEIILNSYNEFLLTKKKLDNEEKELKCELQNLKSKLKSDQSKYDVKFSFISNVLSSRNQKINELKKKINDLQDEKQKKNKILNQKLIKYENEILNYENIIKKLQKTMDHSEQLIYEKVVNRKESILNF